MARNVRGPMSALTDFLQSTGITPTTIARRAATRAAENAEQPEAGPSNPRRGRAQEDHQEEYDSDNLDEPERKQKAAAKKKKKKGEHDDSDDEYTALSKTAYAPTNKPAVGSFENCATCEKQFTVTKYTMAAMPGPGFLCHPCAKASGADPFKKPASPRKRKAPAEKRTVVHIQQRSFPTLVSLCIDVIARHIDDVEAFGDIGSLNLEAIARALSKNRRLTTENAPLFYNIENTNLAFYDATNLSPDAFVALGNLNPNLTRLRLDFCGPLNDEAILSWNRTMPSLVSLELFGPFLVREAAWISFFQAHTNMVSFLITQSPRFSLACLQALIDASGSTISQLRLREVGLLSAAFAERIAGLSKLTYLDVGEPSESLSDDNVVQLLEGIGSGLTHLDLSGHIELTDEVLSRGLIPNTPHLTSLAMANVPLLSDIGTADFFNSSNQNGDETSGLILLDLSRNHLLKGAALTALIQHSKKTIQELNINGWKDVDVSAEEMVVGKRSTKSEDVEMLPTEPALPLLAHLEKVKKLDLGWCRGVDDFVVKSILEGCEALEELKVWGCNRVEGKWESSMQRKRGVKVYGIESQTGS
ncbi:RNI-like protein [Mycena indigotica]|uniref:RNI-like protein n=1 Tax=Mycena indigotica TaxID=2126181 RepID=A0A8H6WEM6_9AGAR|nr:RNI-like protein [Mycena indigotica]KAF7315854.1 RNI-like protein [Mycena indigotica]